MHKATLSDFTQVLDNSGTAEPVTRQAGGPPKNNDYNQRRARATLYLSSVPGVSKGGRNAAGYSLAARIREKFDLADTDLLEVMADWNGKNTPPLDSDELAEVVRNANHYANNPAGSGYEPMKLQKQNEVHSIGQQRFDEGFQDFIPLESVPLPSFPVEVLPEPLRTLVVEIADSLQVPVDLPGMLSLAAVALVAQKRYEVQPKYDWVEPVNLYVAVILPPAKRKSQVFKIISEPIIEIERALVNDRREIVQRNQSDFSILEKKKAELEKKMVKNSERRGELNEVLREIATFRHVYEPVLLAADVTPEVVSRMLCQNEGRLGIFSSEGGIFATFAGRYQDNKPVNDTFLKAHIGDSIRVDRVGRPSEHIEKPSISMALTIQPTILEHLGHKRLLEDTGMLGRFLYSIPYSGQDTTFYTPPISATVKQDYGNVLTALHNRGAILRILRMSLEYSAIELFEKFYLEVNQRLNTGDLAGIVSWAGKLCGHTLRIAALFELAERAHNGDDIDQQPVISEKNIAGAILLARYLIPHAQRAFQQLGRDENLHIAEKMVLWISRMHHKSITQKEVYEAVRGLSAISKVSDIVEPLEILVECGYLKRVAPPKGVGRKSTIFEVNPEVFQFENV